MKNLQRSNHHSTGNNSIHQKHARWENSYEQTIVFGVDEIRINGHYQSTGKFTAIHKDLVARAVSLKCLWSKFLALIW